MRKTLMAVALLFALSCPALAGIIHTPGVTQPEPTPTSTTQEPVTTYEDTGAADTLLQTALAVLASLLP